jgi:predicted nucleic acid-binding protein
MNKQLVLDASLAISWCLKDESLKLIESILDSFALGTTAIVPSLWAWEVNNALLIAQRHGKLNNIQRHQEISFLKKLPIDIDEDAHHQVWSETTNLAQKHDLTVYDASYLELALRQGLPLGSLDKSLRIAAKKIGLKCLPEKFDT